MTSNALHKPIEEEDHREDKGSISCLDLAITTVEINCLTCSKGQITERLNETTNDNGQEEDVHIHGPNQSHDDLI